MGQGRGEVRIALVMCTLAVTLCGCAPTIPASDSPEVSVATSPSSPVAYRPPSPSADSSTVGDDPGPTEVIPDSEAGDHPVVEELRFGDTSTALSDGTITMAPPTTVIPSASASTTGTWDEYVVVDVTVTNTWTEPAPAAWRLDATSGGAVTEPIRDPGQGIGAPDLELLPGESTTYRVAFGRSRDEPFRIEVRPDTAWFDYAVFT